MQCWAPGVLGFFLEVYGRIRVGWEEIRALLLL